MVGHAGLGFHSRFTLTNAFRIVTCSMWMTIGGCQCIIVNIGDVHFARDASQIILNSCLPSRPVPSLSTKHTPQARRHAREGGAHDRPAAQRLGHLRAQPQRTAYTNPVWYGTRTHRPMTRSQEPVLECDTAQLDSRQHHAHASCLWLASYNFKTPLSDRGLNLHRISNRASPLFNLVPSGPSAG